MRTLPTVTVLIPARNEEGDIERCLRAVLAQDYPHDRMEVILVDGGSADRTAELATSVLETGDVDWKIIDNPVGTTPSNLNAGLAITSGEILCRVDARSIVPPRYVRLCADVLATRPEVVVTGGAQIAVALDDSVTSVGIARALNNRYGMGGSRYRSRAPSGPSDTVYLGAFRTQQLRAAGGWDEHFETNQDFELNRRMARSGVVWFDDRLEVGYVPRQSITAVWRQYHRFGRWKVRYWRSTGDPPLVRQKVLLAAPVCLLVLLGLLVSGRKPRVRSAAVMTTAAVVALGVVEEAGAPGDRPPVLARLTAIAGMAAVGAAWWLGAVREQLLPSGYRS